MWQMLMCDAIREDFLKALSKFPIPFFCLVFEKIELQVAPERLNASGIT